VSNQSVSDCFIRAGQYKAYVFDAAASCDGCTQDDPVTMINAPLIGLVAVFNSIGRFHSILPVSQIHFIYFDLTIVILHSIVVAKGKDSLHLLQTLSTQITIFFLQTFQQMNNVSKFGCVDSQCLTTNEDYKDTLFLNTTVNEFIFSGYKHGVLRWIIDEKWAGFGSSMPPQILQGNGFAVFNGKNDTAYNE
jgi:hypothetical protein